MSIEDPCKSLEPWPLSSCLSTCLLYLASCVLSSALHSHPCTCANMLWWQSNLHLSQLFFFHRIKPFSTCNSFHTQSYNFHLTQSHSLLVLHFTRKVTIFILFFSFKAIFVTSQSHSPIHLTQSHSPIHLTQPFSNSSHLTQSHSPIHLTKLFSNSSHTKPLFSNSSHTKPLFSNFVQIHLKANHLIQSRSPIFVITQAIL